MTQAELTVLGLVIEEPRHGYDLERVVERRGVREWTDLGFSSIYYVLGKLQDKQYVTSAAGPAAKSRRVYTATKAGRAAARSAALAAVRDVTPLHPSVLTGLANLPLLTAREVADALAERRRQLDERIRTVDATRQSQRPLPEFADWIFSYSLSLMQAERQWLDSLSTPE